MPLGNTGTNVSIHFSIHSFVFSNRFILVMILVDPERIPTMEHSTYCQHVTNKLCKCIMQLGLCFFHKLYMWALTGNYCAFYSYLYLYPFIIHYLTNLNNLFGSYLVTSLISTWINLWCGLIALLKCLLKYLVGMNGKMTCFTLWYCSHPSSCRWID